MKNLILSIFTFTVMWACAMAQTQTVEMNNFTFVPADITITEGTTVTWVNNSDMTHTSTSGTDCTGDGVWNSGNVLNGQSFSMTFDAESAGVYPYFCIPHCALDMTGTVTVEVVSSSSNYTKRNDAIDVYPNPFTQRLTIVTEERFPADFTVELYDLSGHLVMSRERKSYDPSADRITLFTHTLSKGTYVLRLSGEAIEVTRKVTKMQ